MAGTVAVGIIGKSYLRFLQEVCILSLRVKMDLRGLYVYTQNSNFKELIILVNKFTIEL